VTATTLTHLMMSFLENNSSFQYVTILLLAYIIIIILIKEKMNIIKHEHSLLNTSNRHKQIEHLPAETILLSDFISTSRTKADKKYVQF
jgi:hypothetical protein